jgi:hypothetical protein
VRKKASKDFLREHLMAEKPAKYLWYHTAAEGVRIRTGTEEAFDKLAASNPEAALSTDLLPQDRGLPRDLEELTHKCSGCRRISSSVWRQRREAMLRNATTPQAQTGVQRLSGSIPPIPWSYHHHVAPPLREWTRVLRIKLSFSGDLVGRPWAIELTQQSGIGVSVRRSSGNSFRGSLELNVWGDATALKAAKTWATDLGARWDVLSIGRNTTAA